MESSYDYVPDKIDRFYKIILGTTILAFLSLYIITLLQDWPNPYFLIIPITLFSSAIFFIIFRLTSRKWVLSYVPMRISLITKPLKAIKDLAWDPGLLLLLFSIIETSFIYILGIESKTRPQLLDNYGQYLIFSIHLLYVLIIFITLYLILSNIKFFITVIGNNSRLIRILKSKNHGADSDLTRESTGESDKSKDPDGSNASNASFGDGDNESVNGVKDERALILFSPSLKWRRSFFIKNVIAAMSFIIFDIIAYYLSISGILSEELEITIHTPGSQSPFVSEASPFVKVTVFDLVTLVGVTALFIASVFVLLSKIKNWGVSLSRRLDGLLDPYGSADRPGDPSGDKYDDNDPEIFGDLKIRLVYYLEDIFGPDESE